MLTIFPTIFQFLFCLLATRTNVLRCVSSDPKLSLISGFEKNPLRPAGSSSFHTHTAHTEHWWISKLDCSWPGFQSTVCLLQCIGAAAARSETHLTQDWRCRRSPAARSPPPPPPPARSPAAPRGHLHLQLTQTQTFWRPSFQIHFEMLIHKYLVAYIDIALWYLGSKICILLVNFFIILGNNMWAGIFTIRFMALCMELLRMCTGW